VQYMLLIYDDETIWSSMPEEERNGVFQEYSSYTEALKQAGKFVAADALQGTETAKTVQVREGTPLTTDGPFAETKEHLGGYYLVDVDSEEEALEWAAKIPSARFGKVEVRPVVVFPVEATAS
jgi:hypothetical protein